VVNQLKRRIEARCTHLKPEETKEVLETGGSPLQLYGRKFPIKFLRPTEIDPANEKRSKQLDPDSELYAALAARRQELRKVHGDRILHPPQLDFHIEVMPHCGTAYTEDDVLRRVQQLEGQLVELRISHLHNNAMVVNCPPVDGLGPTHITVAYFPNGLPFPGFE
jgi:hypothetical protein